MASTDKARWRDDSFDNEYAPSLILRHPDLLKLLKESRTLKHISILFTIQWLEDRIDATNCSITLKGFRNLTSLELYHFYGDKAEILEDLASTLGDSPRLQTLGLALAVDCDCDAYPEAVEVEDELDFFEKLCIEYGSRNSRSPLPLKTLKLGHGMYILKLDSTKNAPIGNYLASLVKLSDVKVLRIFNGLFKMSVDEEPESMEIAWSLFEECTSLHQLSVTRLGDDVRDWLNTVGRSVEELIVTEQYGTFDVAWENLNALKLPHLTTLFTQEEGGSKPDSEDEWSDIDSIESDTDEHSDLLKENPGNPDSSTEPLPIVDRSIRTVLDRLHDGGAKLERLCLSLDFETQWVSSSSYHPPLVLTLTGAIFLLSIEDELS
jgi:hypothetical protein